MATGDTPEENETPESVYTTEDVTTEPAATPTGYDQASGTFRP